jgi:serine/threonine-protein kinase
MVDWSGKLLRGTYEVGALLGEGGMGAVYEARNVRLGRRVAIKILHSRGASDPAMLERFQREAEITASLEHPHIPAVYDLWVDGDPALIVMERLEGRSLLQVLRDEGALEPARVLRLSTQLLSGLAAAHGAAVVHRDLKPSNLFVTTGYDGGEVVKILDFGVARLLPSTGADPITRTGQVLGTIDHMAPEQATGTRVDARADIYAVGTIMWSALVGRTPFRGDNPAMVLHHVLMGCDEPLLRIRPELGSLAAIVDRAMSVAPEARFSTADEMADALRRVDVAALSSVSAPVTASLGGPPLSPTRAADPPSGAPRPVEVASSTAVAAPIAPSRPGAALWLAVAAAGGLGGAALLAAGAYLLLGTGASPPPDPAAVAPRVDPPAPAPAEAKPSFVPPVTPLAIVADASAPADRRDAGARASGPRRAARRSPRLDDPPGADTCAAHISTYVGITSRTGTARTWEAFRDPAYFEINRTCFPRSRLGHFDLRVELDEHGRLTSARVERRSPTVTAREAACVSRITRRHGLRVDGPDSIVFHHLQLRCNE